MSEHSEHFAPVLIGTCNRLNHFKALVESLQACYWAEETQLYIAIDAPYAEEVREVNQEIRNYTKAIAGFAKVHIIDRPNNFGPVENFEQAMNDIFQLHTTLILLEDDNIVARNFLVYMNKALRAFEHEPKCFAICGYNFTSEPIEEPSITDVYASRGFQAWGIGYWKRKYKRQVLSVPNKPEKWFLNPFNLAASYQSTPFLFAMYIGSFLQGRYFSDVLSMITVQKNDYFAILPRVSKVINRGFDGSGVHCPAMDFKIHDKFDDETRVDFNFQLVEKVNSMHSLLNHRFYKDNIPIKPLMQIYAYLIYIASFFLGREKTIVTRDFIKSGISLLTRINRKYL
jgi:hypothetical protein